MLRKTSNSLTLLFVVAALLFISCGGGGGGGALMSGGGTAADEKPTVEVNNDSAGATVVVKTVNGGLPINGESLPVTSYTGTDATITITDENGTCTYTINDNGDIIITPSDGDASGTYNVVITATVTVDGVEQEREYLLIIAVDADGNSVVNTSISYPSGSHMVLDLSSGKINNADINGDGAVDDSDILIISSISGTSYVTDSTIVSVTVKDSSGQTVNATIDPVTGDMITGGTGSDTYTITVVKNDGTTITTYTIVTDSLGQIITISTDGVNHVLIPVVNGTATIVPPVTIEGIEIKALIDISEYISGAWSQLDSITGITATSANGTALNGVTVDPLTGSIITSDLTLAETTIVIKENTDEGGKITHSIIIDADGNVISYIKVEIKPDGTTITTIILLDENGNVKEYSETVTKPNGETTTTLIVVTDSGTTLTVTNTGIVLRLNSGSASADGFVLALTAKPDGLWTLKSGVEIVSCLAGNGSIEVDLSSITVDPVSGHIMINGTGNVVQKGPYEMRVNIGDASYVIKSDANGNIISIIPGNTLLQLTDGYMTFDGRSILKIIETDGSISSMISSLTAADSDGKTVTLNVYNGNIVTSDSFTDPVTLTFLYTDDDGNGITYTVIIKNGSVYSYTAEITNPSADFDFSTVTNIKVYLYVVDANTGSPLKQASINLTNASAEDSWVGYTDDSGKSVFTATVASASQTTSISVTHSGYVSISSPITGIGKLIEIGKKIAMTPEEVVTVPTDTDNDGVPDDEDDYPNDDTGAKAITGVYTLAYEDLYPSPGDADFEDLVVRLTIIEKIDSQNMVRQINLKTKLLAGGAGNTNQFAINIKTGTDENGYPVFKNIMLISNPKEESIYTLGPTSQNNLDSAYRNCVEKEHDSIVFSSGISRDELAPMPFDPYIICDGYRKPANTGVKESHLPSVLTPFTKAVTFSGYIDMRSVGLNYFYTERFAWAVIVPNNWIWAKGSTSANIFLAYPNFQTWYESDGELMKDWYNYPATGYIYQNYVP